MDDAIFIALVPAAAISIVTLIVVSLLTQKANAPRPMLNNDGQDMSMMPKFFWSKQA